MPGLVIGGKEYVVPGLEVINFKDDPRLRLKMGEDGGPRTTRWVRSIGVHSTKGIPGGKDHRQQVILPNLAEPCSTAERVARYWSSDPTTAGAHLVVDHDGTVVCLADLSDEKANHAGASNASSIGIEVYQGNQAEFYDGQLDVVVTLIDSITFIFTDVLHGSIQRQYHAPYYPNRPMDRMDVGTNDYVGIYGHRDQTSNRGQGDPGDWLAAKLQEVGYEEFDFTKGEDLAAWKVRQAQLKMEFCDGIPGPKTAELLRAQTGSGLWVSRPFDTAMQTSLEVR